VTILDIDGSYTSKMYPELKNASRAGDAGYVITDLTIENIIAHRKEVGNSYCPLIAVSNGDNMYSHNFIPATITAINNGYDIVATHFVSRYNWFKDPIQHQHSGPFRHGKDTEIRTKFYPGFIDLGCVVFKINLLETSGYRFVIDSIRKNINKLRDIDFPREYYGLDFNLADGILFRKLAHMKDVDSKVINRALYIHQ